MQKGGLLKAHVKRILFFQLKRMHFRAGTHVHFLDHIEMITLVSLSIQQIVLRVKKQKYKSKSSQSVIVKGMLS